MREIGGGLSGFRGQVDQTSRSSGILNNQLKAMGTTFRYALAGSILFTVPQMVRNLANFEQQLGLIAAIGSQGNLPLVGQQVTDIGIAVQTASVNSITPVNEFNDALINLYSTIGGQQVSPNQAVEMVTSIAQASQLMQVNVTEAQQAFMQMNFAFRRPQTPSGINAQAREFFALIQQAPGGIAAGPQIIQQMGPLSRVAAFAGMTQEQTMALTLQSLRGGGTPATNLRGLQFLIQSLVQPQTKEAKETLASIGITPESIRTMPGAGFGALRTIIQHVRGLGGVQGAGRAMRVDPDELGMVSDDPAAATTALGISGEGAQFLAKAFHRVHALRAAVGLIVRGEPELLSGLNIIDKAQKDQLDDVGNMSKAWQRYEQRAQLKKVPIAINALGIQTAEIFKPIISLAAGGVLGAQGYLSKHQEETKYGVGAAAGAIGIAAALRRLRGLGAGGGLFGLRNIGRGVIGAQAISGAIEGTAPKGTVTDPLFVVTLPGFGAGGRGAEKAGEVASRAARRRIPGLPLTLGLAGLGAAEAAVLLSTPGASAHTRKNYPLSDPHFRQGHPLFTHMANIAGRFQDPDYRRGHPRQWDVMQRYREHQISQDQAERLFQRIARSNQREHPRMHITVAGPDGRQPKAEVHVKADRGTHVDGRRDKRVHVPLELFPDFGPGSSRGKPKSSRG